MFTLQSANDIIFYLTRLIAYFLVIAPGNIFMAWVNKKMGDPTAAQQGFINLNPLVHVDIVGAICATLFGFGWVRQAPLNPSNIIGRFRSIKVIIAGLSGVFMYSLQAAIYIVLLAVLFGHNLDVLRGEQASSFAIVIGRIFSASVFESSFLALLSLIFNGVIVFANFIGEKRYYDPRYLLYLLVIPILLLLIFGQQLHVLIMSGIIHIADFISRCIGIT